MAGSRTKAVAVILLLFLFIDCSIGQVLGIAQGMNLANPQIEGIAKMKKKRVRKMVEMDAVYTLDYESEGPNRRHEPPKKPGGGNL